MTSFSRHALSFSEHHVFPQQYQQVFRDLDIDVDKFTVGMERSSHRVLHSGKGMGSGGIWNNAWRGFLGIQNGRATVVRSRDDVIRFGAGMLQNLLAL